MGVMSIGNIMSSAGYRKPQSLVQYLGTSKREKPLSPLSLKEQMEGQGIGT